MHIYRVLALLLLPTAPTRGYALGPRCAGTGAPVGRDGLGAGPVPRPGSLQGCIGPRRHLPPLARRGSSDEGPETSSRTGEDTPRSLDVKSRRAPGPAAPSGSHARSGSEAFSTLSQEPSGVPVPRPGKKRAYYSPEAWSMSEEASSLEGPAKKRPSSSEAASSHSHKPFGVHRPGNEAASTSSSQEASNLEQAARKRTSIFASQGPEPLSLAVLNERRSKKIGPTIIEQVHGLIGTNNDRVPVDHKGKSAMFHVVTPDPYREEGLQDVRTGARSYFRKLFDSPDTLTTMYNRFRSLYTSNPATSLAICRGQESRLGGTRPAKYEERRTTGLKGCSTVAEWQQITPKTRDQLPPHATPWTTEDLRQNLIGQNREFRNHIAGQSGTEYRRLDKKMRAMCNLRQCKIAAPKGFFISELLGSSDRRM